MKIWVANDEIDKARFASVDSKINHTNSQQLKHEEKLKPGLNPGASERYKELTKQLDFDAQRNQGPVLSAEEQLLKQRIQFNEEYEAAKLLPVVFDRYYGQKRGGD